MFESYNQQQRKKAPVGDYAVMFCYFGSIIVGWLITWDWLAACVASTLTVFVAPVVGRIYKGPVFELYRSMVYSVVWVGIGGTIYVLFRPMFH